MRSLLKLYPPLGERFRRQFIIFSKIAKKSTWPDITQHSFKTSLGHSSSRRFSWATDSHCSPVTSAYLPNDLRRGQHRPKMETAQPHWNLTHHWGEHFDREFFGKKIIKISTWPGITHHNLNMVPWPKLSSRTNTGEATPLKWAQIDTKPVLLGSTWPKIPQLARSWR